CFFALREILLGLCAEVGGGDFITVSADGLRVQLAKGRRSECRFEFTAPGGEKADVSLLYNRRFVRPKAPKTSWEGSYTSSFEPELSVRLSGVGTSPSAHWLECVATDRAEREAANEPFERVEAEERDGPAGDYQEE